MRCTLHVTVADAGELTAVIEAIEGLGAAVECPAHDARERLRDRDEFLRAAHALMNGSTPWRRCTELESDIRRFEAVLWPRLRDRETPPEGCSGLRACLFRARRLGPLPTTAKQLWNIIVKRNSPCDFREKRFSSAPEPDN
jgi:hypothetical protein